MNKVFIVVLVIVISLVSSVAVDYFINSLGAVSSVSNNSKKNSIPKESKPAPTKKWNFVKQWSGSSIKTTETFSVGDEWMVIWDTKPGNMGDGLFAIYINDSQGNPVGVDANVTGKGSDSRVHHGAGDFYFTINTMQPYVIRVLTK